MGSWNLAGLRPYPNYDRLKVAPFGMGFLLTTGSLPDPRALYCPSALDVQVYFKLDPPGGNALYRHPRVDGTVSGWLGHERQNNVPNDTLRAWLQAGGLTPKTLTHGNWPRESRWSSFVGYSVFSQYAYRNQPIFGRQGSDAVYGIIYTRRPVVVSHQNAPAFKTPRQLRSRALVSDIWHKDSAVTEPGYGMQIHRDGYNVLYGDYSVRWYGDTEQRIIWWEHLAPPHATGGHNHGLFWSKDYHRPFSETAGAVRWRAPLVWHTIDRVAGMDLDVNPMEYTQNWHTQVGLPYRDLP